uniref:Splicing factor u2af1 n=1 Tax=Paramecium bursaria TaxID=74790 RepID=A0A8G1D0U1_9CILI|nr:splicing factor u2af1 [Paramecium bursaria]
MSDGKMEIEIKVEKVEEQDIKEDIDSDEQEKPVAAVIKKKKKKQKKKKKWGENVKDEVMTDFDDDWELKAKHSKILNDPDLPSQIKEKYAIYENNPYMMIVSQVPLTVQLKEIEEYFNTLITNIDTKINEKPIKSIEYGATKSWVVLECSSIDAKRTLLPLNQVEFVNHKLKIERPRKFLERILNPVPNEQVTELKLDDTRLYLGGLPTYLKDDDVLKLIQTFGITKYFNLVKDTTSNSDISKGYCFFEYENPSSTVKALKALNNLQIGDKRLKICKVQGDTAQVKKVNGKEQPSNYAGCFLASCELLRIPQIQQMLTIPQQAMIPSKVVQFLNMCSIEDLFEDDVYEEIMEDVRSECQRYGQVDRIEVPRPDKETGYCCPAVGKIFVKFYYQIPAKKAKFHLAGRTYNKRTVITSFYPEEQFDYKDYLING